MRTFVFSTAWLVLSLLGFAGVGTALPSDKARRDADFLEVRTKMTKDMSGRKGDPKEKYFREFCPL
jgi:hypothetical protein